MTHKLLINKDNPDGILVEMTSEELAQRQLDEQQEQQEKIAREQAQQARLEANQSAINKLKALGLTDAEVEAFRGK